LKERLGHSQSFRIQINYKRLTQGLPKLHFVRKSAPMSGLRKLRWHEQKLLKKVDFLQWEHDRNVRTIKILRRYVIENREDYVK
jgi:hypothetical protein